MKYLAGYSTADRNSRGGNRSARSEGLHGHRVAVATDKIRRRGSEIEDLSQRSGLNINV